MGRGKNNGEEHGQEKHKGETGTMSGKDKVGERLKCVNIEEMSIRAIGGGKGQ